MATSKNRYRCPRCRRSDSLSLYESTRWRLGPRGKLSEPRLQLSPDYTDVLCLSQQGLPAGRGCGFNGKLRLFMITPPPAAWFVHLEDARLRANYDGKVVFDEAATKANARKLGRQLRDNNTIALYSSSLDFPREYGARNYDWRQLIEDGAADTKKE